MADNRSLLDRLNALKPSGVTLDSSFQTTSAAIHVTPATAASAGSVGVAAGAPESRADALAARLRLLRHQDDTTSTSTSTDEPRRKHIATASAVPSPALPPTALSAVHSHGYQSDDDDPLLFSDEQALSSFLTMGGKEEEEDDEDDHDDDGFILLPDVPAQSRLDLDDEVEDADNEKKVADLLRSLGGPSTAGKEDGGPSHDADDDDSDGDDMGREVRRVLDQARDEADWAVRQQGDGDDEGRREAVGGDVDAPEDSDKTSPKHPEDASSTTGGHAEGDAEGDADALRLPAVPTKLVDPPQPSSGGCDDDAADIAVRLAALRGLSGREAGLGHTDAFGLPSAPTFQPGDQQHQQQRRRHHTSSPSLAHGRVGYTDADQRSWCVVCLEDAAVRCLGCDDDPYCARCWREMHVGPAAGFDERGHKRVPLRWPG